jgi:hypothetical protein
VAELQQSAGREQSSADQGLRELLTAARLDLCELAGEIDWRVVTEHRGRAREGRSRQIEPREAGAGRPGDLRRGDFSDLLRAGCRERHLLLV